MNESRTTPAGPISGPNRPPSPEPGPPGTHRSPSDGSAVDRSSPQRVDRVPRTPGTARGPCPIHRAEPLPRPFPRASAEKELPRRLEARGSPPFRSPPSGGGFRPHLSPSRPFRPRWGRSGHYGGFLSPEKARKPPGTVMPPSWNPTRRVLSWSTPSSPRETSRIRPRGGFRAPTAPHLSTVKERASVDGASPKKSSYNWGYTTSRRRYPLRLEPGFPG